MASYLEKVQHSPNINRRDFLKASTAATAALAVGGLVGCAPTSQEEAKSEKAGIQERNLVEGTWVTAACWHNCGGRCLNKALVKDGIVVRQKTDDTHEDSPDYPQQRACLRGRAQRKQVFAADRIKYPMKRKGWSPDNPQGELRGKDEWERISWDEALTYVADELKKAKEKYGNRSILAAGSEIGRTLTLFGGYTASWGTGSYGSFALTAGIVGVDTWSGGINDRIDMRENTELFVMVGSNPAWSSGGSPAFHMLQAKQNGARFIAVDPYYNDTYELLGAEWLPIRPGTDTAFLIGLAYAILDGDAQGKGLIDWDFLNTHTIGFDEQHMPEGSDTKGNFKDYLLGTYDGVPKTPEWAEVLCGVPAERVRKLAEEIAPDVSVALLCGWAPARTHNSDNFPQIFSTIGAMTGHMGKPGHMTGVNCHNAAGNGGPGLVNPGSSGVTPIKDLPVDDSINKTEIWKAILTGQYVFNGRSGTVTMPADAEKAPGEIRDIDIHVIYHGGGAALQTTDAMSEGIEAHRKVDFVVSHAQFVTTNALYSDIILPVTTLWERPGGLLVGNREMLIMHTQVTEPLFESQSDQWIARELAKKLGIDESAVYDIDENQQFFNEVAGATYVEEDGVTVSPLVTITDDDIKEWGVEGSSQEGAISFKDFKDRGVFQIERKSGDKYGFIAYSGFAQDPEKNPLPSLSGKLEIYSARLAEIVNEMGYSTIEPVPTYIHQACGYEDTFEDFASGQKGSYPFQIFNIHYLRRSHTVFDNIPWLREAWENPVYLNAQDASGLGIAAGDTVRITSPYGKVLRKATLTNRVVPGVVMLPHGAWVDKDETDDDDTAGADNIICGGCPTGQGVSGWNTAICNVEKVVGETLEDDSVRMQRMICE
ncbi:molybdopterin-dependent oxidoreductase [Eggerthella sp. YY7918]|uniref:molybdopterin-dependent oxidoreductase n=1 Tax=Eggerthella sp. (strain YY7918) TaxID=502558 RepID=UPI00021712BB|nr:molybdopterin-dependent oxidoreductase [Eggerthella sp. YY7918]BAK44192.1 anaerobic dehydrogenase [Eggerthella sp. YY7918]